MTIELKKLLGTAAVLLAVLIPAGIWFQLRQETVSVLPTGAWGLSFHTPNTAPVADVSQEELGRFDAKYIGNTDKKTICLTFDCGYENGCTETILDVLKKHNVKAAFFVVGHYIETQPELVCRMAKEGHIVGNHTWNHPDMSAISNKAEFQHQLEAVSEAFEACTGETMPMYYRPPQGVYSEENLKMAQELGYKTVFWSLAYVDWNADDQPTETEAMEKLTGRIHNGAVVLLHNTSTTNAAILDRLLTTWKEMGYEFETLDELFKS